MRVAVSGPRGKSCPPATFVLQALRDAPYQFSGLLHGGATGVDAIAEWWAKCVGVFQVTCVSAEWGKHGKSAGPIRNRKMLEEADALVAIARTDRPTPGTYDCIQEAWRRGLPMFLVFWHGDGS